MGESAKSKAGSASTRPLARLAGAMTVVACISIFGVSAMFTSSGQPESSGDWVTLLLVLVTAMFMTLAFAKSEGTVRVLTGVALGGAIAILIAWFLRLLKPEDKYGAPIGANLLWLLGLVLMVVFSLSAWITAERTGRPSE